MRFARALAGCACLAALMLLSSNSGIQSQDKKDPAPKGTRQLPSNWGKLDLTPAQKEEVYKLQAEYKTKTDKLADEIRALNAELAKKRSAVLTADQKKKLAELVGADPGESKEKAKEKSKEKGKE
jgi:Spy/CpxP family protein refolding chaperone